MADGNGLPWKLATWGSALDERLLSRLERHRFIPIGNLTRNKIHSFPKGSARLETEYHQRGRGTRPSKSTRLSARRFCDMAPNCRDRGTFSVSVSRTPVEPELISIYEAFEEGVGGFDLPSGPHVIVRARRATSPSTRSGISSCLPGKSASSVPRTTSGSLKRCLCTLVRISPSTTSS